MNLSISNLILCSYAGTSVTRNDPRVALHWTSHSGIASFTSSFGKVNFQSFHMLSNEFLTVIFQSWTFYSTESIENAVKTSLSTDTSSRKERKLIFPLLLFTSRMNTTLMLKHSTRIGVLSSTLENLQSLTWFFYMDIDGVLRIRRIWYLTRISHSVEVHADALGLVSPWNKWKSIYPFWFLSLNSTLLQRPRYLSFIYHSHINYFFNFFSIKFRLWWNSVEDED